ncbi:hypothetical protein BAUCODRAFT_333356 [Baudoinia panamericana UAMH 10762]|uniref:Uncharacterized protein n=1 Tax=Baudoinia panamericana (strain UAMH 10762) TaxID=717646 RepID=M2MWR9_BAUPA|nr:uncharacterized protein BAUCODRAFT_333356 [Baudoinia panamericana UAMH 10762]EMC91044.1 hypothetical protein BAUCODRAFT_333356 [Baudoinia panamericana UAMH 10762]
MLAAWAELHFSACRLGYHLRRSANISPTDVPWPTVCCVEDSLTSVFSCVTTITGRCTTHYGLVDVEMNRDFSLRTERFTNLDPPLTIPSSFWEQTPHHFLLVGLLRPWSNMRLIHGRLGMAV